MWALLPLILVAGSPLFEMDPAALDTYLRESAANGQSFQARLAGAAQRALRTPYADGPLGEGPTGHYDTDPLIDLHNVDCVTYVEQTLALATAATYAEMFENLQQIRYKDGQTTFEHRNHFMITDWIANNPFCIDITPTLGVPTQALIRTISKRDFFRRVDAPELGRHTPDTPTTLHYIPAAHTAQAEAQLPSPSLIIFLGNTDWLFSLHCGLYLKEDGQPGKLYHASSKAQKVVAVGLPQYIAQQKDRYIGFTAYSLTAPPAPN